MKKVIDKTVNLDLVGNNGNAYVILGLFARAAKKEGWLKTEIDTVVKEAISGDYDHLLATVLNHCEAKGPEDIDSDEVWEVLSQLGHYTHYLASKAIESWDEYDHSNYKALRKKAGKK